MKNIKIIMLAVVISIVAGCSNNAPSTNTPTENTGSEAKVSGVVPTYTPGANGIGYILSAGINNLFNHSKVMPEVNLVTEATSGSTELMSLLFDRADQGKPAFAINAAVSVVKLFNGKEESLPGEHSNLRAVSALGYAAIHIAVPADSSIQTFYDLKGKRIGANPKSAPEAYLKELLQAGYGLGEGDYTLLPLGYEEVREGLQNGSIDAGILVGAFPAPTVMQAAQSVDLRLLSIGNEEWDKFFKEYPYYGLKTAKAGTYPKQDADVTMGTLDTLVVTHDKTPDALVYNYMKVIFDNKEEFDAIHASAKTVTEENVAENLMIPVHPGAEKYFKEKGILK